MSRTAANPRVATQPLQDSQWFKARLRHLKERQPVKLHTMLVQGHRQQAAVNEHPLTKHLLQIAHDATQAHGRLLEQGTEPDAARERVMNDLVAPPETPQESTSTLQDRERSRLLAEWNLSLDNLPPIHHL